MKILKKKISEIEKTLVSSLSYLEKINKNFN